MRRFIEAVRTRADLLLAVGMTAAFLVYVGWTAALHEMWRDELQAWLLARDSTGPIDLHRHLKYEGHPGLWHLLLLPLTRLSWNPVGMQVLHLLIAAAAVFLFLRYARFNRLARCLFALGYFPAYEYAVVCRNYGVGMLLLFAFAALFRSRFQRFHWIGLSLMLACHTSVHALIVTIALGAGLGLEALISRRELAEMRPEARRRVWIGFGLIALGVVTAVLQLNPPADYGFARGWRTNLDWNHVRNIAAHLNRALYAIPKGGWGSHYLFDWAFYNAHRLWFGVGLAALFAATLWRRPAALLAYLMATIGLLTFFYMKYSGSIRHHGFLYLALVTVAWTAPNWSGLWKTPSAAERLVPYWKKWIAVCGTMLLFGAHAYGGLRTHAWDRETVFSRAKETAEYMREAGLQDAYVIGHDSPSASAVVGYLEKDRFFYPRGKRMSSFVRWDQARNHGMSNREVAEMALARSDETSEETIVVLSSHFSDDVMEELPRIELLKEFMDPAAIGNERFAVYRVHPPEKPE